MKPLFKIFGCLTVLVFFAVATVYLFITSPPPAVRVKSDVRQYIYPVARENLKIQFENIQRNLFQGGELEMDFVVTELEANALLDQYFPVREGFPIIYPYIYLKKGIIRFRCEISFENLRKFIINKMKQKSLDENIRALGEKSRMTTNLSVIIDVGIKWEKKYPYVYLAGARLGILPLPVHWLLGEYTPRFNGQLHDWLDENIEEAPILVRGADFEENMVKLHVEKKITGEDVRMEEMKGYFDSDVPLVRSLDRMRSGCRFGCSEERQKAIRAYILRAAALREDFYLEDEKAVDEAKRLMEPETAGRAKPEPPRTAQPGK
ncbi:MAG: hypothetical protein AB1742_16145 [bacterium]